MVILKRPSYVHELNEAYWQRTRTRLGWCLLQRVHESLCYHVVRVRVRGQIRPLGHRCASRGLVYGSGPAGKRLRGSPTCLWHVGRRPVSPASLCQRI